MKNKTALFVGLLIVVNMAIIRGKDSNPDQDILEMTELEEYLKTAEIEDIEIDKFVGRTAPWGVVLNNGKITRRALFKYVNRQRPALLPDSYHYEIAAYELSKLVKYFVVPPVVEREIKETPGSLYLFLEGCFTLDQQQRRGVEPEDIQKFSDALSELAVFENLVLCKRVSEDIYIQEKDWKIWRVDFSEAFAPFEELDQENEFTRCSKTLFDNLQGSDETEIRAKLQPHLNEEEILALLKRKDLIIDKIKLLIKEKGENHVLF